MPGQSPPPAHLTESVTDRVLTLYPYITEYEKAVPEHAQRAMSELLDDITSLAGYHRVAGNCTTAYTDAVARTIDARMAHNSLEPVLAWPLIWLHMYPSSAHVQHAAALGTIADHITHRGIRPTPRHGPVPPLDATGHRAVQLVRAVAVVISAHDGRIPGHVADAVLDPVLVALDRHIPSATMNRVTHYSMDMSTDRWDAWPQGAIAMIASHRTATGTDRASVAGALRTALLSCATWRSQENTDEEVRNEKISVPA